MGTLLGRIAATLPVMGVVEVIVFLLIHLSPGDPAALIAGDLASTDDIARLRTTLGLDQPLWTQFALWAARLAHGDLGTSIFSNLPVTTMIGQRIEPTLSLMAITLLFAVCVAVPIVTVIGSGVALLIGGAVVTETVFAIPGVGRLTVDAILRRDYPVIQGIVLLFSFVYVLVNLIVDLTYTVLDPRIRY